MADSYPRLHTTKTHRWPGPIKARLSRMWIWITASSVRYRIDPRPIQPHAHIGRGHKVVLETGQSMRRIWSGETARLKLANERGPAHADDSLRLICRREFRRSSAAQIRSRVHTYISHLASHLTYQAYPRTTRKERNHR